MEVGRYLPCKSSLGIIFSSWQLGSPGKQQQSGRIHRGCRSLPCPRGQESRLHSPLLGHRRQRKTEAPGTEGLCPPAVWGVGEWSLRSLTRLQSGCFCFHVLTPGCVTLQKLLTLSGLHLPYYSSVCLLAGGCCGDEIRI